MIKLIIFFMAASLVGIYMSERAYEAKKDIEDLNN